MPDVTFFAHPPCAALAPFVECLWGVRGSADYSVEATLPDGVVQLMVNFGPQQKVVGYGDRVADDTFARAWVAGVQEQRLVHSSSVADHLAVRFHPGGAHAFFDLPIDAMSNGVIELDLLIGSDATELRDRLLAAGDDRARCLALEAWLLERGPVVHPYYGTVRRALAALTGAGLRTTVGAVCQSLGLSNRHLIEQFRRVVGVTPKSAGRIARFQAVVGACRGRTAVNWAAVAAEHGFADQSHLIREFHRLASATPSAFLSRRTHDEMAIIVA